jgi:hypothetical protein
MLSNMQFATVFQNALVIAYTVIIMYARTRYEQVVFYTKGEGRRSLFRNSVLSSNDSIYDINQDKKWM